MLTKRARTWIGRGVTLTVLSVVVFLGAATWALSGTIAARLLAVPSTAGSATVVRLSAGEITLGVTPAAARPGTWGLVTDTGWAVLGPVITGDEATVRRVLVASGGTLRPGSGGRITTSVYGPDPTARGIGFDEVIYEGADGEAEAWITAGVDDTWVVFVTDLGSDRTEALRLLPLFARLGLPTVVPAASGSGGGGGDLGTGSWREVAAAVEVALDGGAEDVVLVGYGTGASSALVALAQPRVGPHVSALVLDSPLLDPRAIADGVLAADKVPGFLVGWAKAMTTVRFGIDWNDLDHVAAASSVAVPVLVVHGDADGRFPVEASRAFVAGAPRATLLVVSGAGHGEAWNLDPAGYEAALAGFLRTTVLGLAGTPSSAG